MGVLEVLPQASKCFGNATNVTEDPHTNETIRQLHILYFGYLTLPIVGFGLPLAFLYFTSVARAMTERRVSRKCYCLILDRTMGDMVACLAGIVLAILTLHHTVGRDLTILLETMLIGCVWSAMVSYVTLSLLKLFAVARPLSFRRAVTMHLCVKIIKISWIVYLTMVGIMWAFSIAIRYEPVAAFVQCGDEEDCSRLIHRTRVVIHCAVVLICYAATLTSFCITIFYIKFHRANITVNLPVHSQLSVEQQINRCMRFSMFKLGLHVGTFVLVNAVHCVYSLIQVFHTDRCLYQHKKVEMFHFYSIARTIILLRIIIDPVVSFCTDFKIRCSAYEILSIPVNWSKRLHSSTDTSSEPHPKHSNLTNSDARHKSTTCTLDGYQYDSPKKPDENDEHYQRIIRF